MASGLHPHVNADRVEVVSIERRANHIESDPGHADGGAVQTHQIAMDAERGGCGFQSVESLVRESIGRTCEVGLRELECRAKPDFRQRISRDRRHDV